MAAYRYIKLTITRRRGVILVVDNTVSIAFDSYRYTTANDAEARDPVSWYVAGSSDGSNWTLLDSRTGETITASRTTNTSTYTLPGGAVSYRYIKWSIFDTKTASTGTTQFSEFVLMSGGSPVAWNGAASATNPGGNSGGSESPAQAIDGNTATKMLADMTAADVNCQLADFTLCSGGSPVAWNAGCVETNPGGTPAGGEGADQLTDQNSATKWNDTAFTSDTHFVIGSTVLKFDNTTSITFDGYRLTTANDVPYRDPSTWKLEGSNDDSVYSTLDERFGESLPAARTTNSIVYALTAASPATPIEFVGSFGRRRTRYGM